MSKRYSFESYIHQLDIVLGDIHNVLLYTHGLNILSNLLQVHLCSICLCTIVTAHITANLCCCFRKQHCRSFYTAMHNSKAKMMFTASISHLHPMLTTLVDTIVANREPVVQSYWGDSKIVTRQSLASR